MIKLTVFIITALILQGVVSEVTKYDDDFSFVNVWNEIESEIKQVILHLRLVKTEDEQCAKIVIYQFQKLATIIGDVISGLREKTQDHEVGDIIFKRVMYVFQEVHNSLKHTAVFHNSSVSLQIRSKLIYNLEVVCEHMEELVYIAKTYCPQLRAVLRTLLVDFLKCIHGFRNSSGILEQNVTISESPRRMVTQIEILTQEFTKILLECNHIEEIRIVFRGFTQYVNEILEKLNSETPTGDGKIDIVVHNLVNKLQEMLEPLLQLLVREELNVKLFQAVITNHFFTVNAVFEEVVQLINDDCPIKSKNFLETIIYYYYYAIKQTHFEINTAYKNAFYAHNDKFFGDTTDHEFSGSNWKYGNDFEGLNGEFSDKLEHSSFYDILLERLDWPHSHETAHLNSNPFYNADLDPSVNSVTYATVNRDENYNSFQIESPEELFIQIQNSVTKIFTHLKYTPNQSIYVFRKFVDLLKQVTDRIEKEHEIDDLSYTKPVIKSLGQYLKTVATEMENSLDDPDSDNLHNFIQMVLTELCKIIIVEKMEDHGFEHVLIKEICFQFLNFFGNVSHNNDSDQFHSKTENQDSFKIDPLERMVNQIQALVKKIFSNLHYTLNVNSQLKKTSYFYREYVQVLEYVIDKIDKEIKVGHLMYAESAMQNFVYYLKSVKIKIENGFNDQIGQDTDNFVQLVPTELYKLVMVKMIQDFDFEHVLIKDICLQFHNFFSNILYKINLYYEEFQSKLDNNEHLKQPYKFMFVRN